MAAKKARPGAGQGVVVLGMPGSGSSALAGVLERMGRAGPRAPAPTDSEGAGNPGERSGSAAIRDLNDAVLSSGGSSWDDWRAFDPAWFASPSAAGLVERGAAVLGQECGGAGPFVLDDFRTGRLVPFWRRVFKAAGVRPLYVLHHRDPVAVAAALHESEGWPPGYGLLLWLRHALDAEAGTRGRARVFTSHDRVLDDWAGVVGAIRASGRVAFPQAPERAGPDRIGEEIDALPDAGSRRGAGARGGAMPDLPVSKWIARTLAVLEGWADGGEDPGDHKKLDTIRAQFDRTVPLFGSLIETMRRATDEVAGLEAGVADLNAGRIAEAQAREAAEAERDALRREARDLADEKWQIQSELAQRKLEIEETGARQREDAERVAALTAELERLSHEHDESRRAVRLDRIRMRGEFEERMTGVVVTHRARSDAETARLRSEMQGLHRAVAAADAATRAAIAERDRLAEAEGRLAAMRETAGRKAEEREGLARSLAEHQKRLAELEEANEMIMRSTSWKLTAPLRIVLNALRR